MRKTRLLLGLVFFLLLAAAAFNQEITEKEFETAMTTVKQKAFSVPPCALKPPYSDQFQPGSFRTTFVEAVFNDSGSYDPVMYAPVHLPQGAVVKSIYAACVDNDDGKYLRLSLIRRDVKESTAAYMAILTTSGLASSWKQRVLKNTFISYSLINNYFTYFLEVNFSFNHGSNDLSFLGFWIVYE
ncbi:MAG: hypothetical protein JXB23_17515 [Candidatus Aminicenantes bacterium]|nr:hypothetical protein [Candidatus Aminicenantes bacterium]